MRVYNRSDSPVVVDGGREIPARSHGDANTRDRKVAELMDRGVLIRPPAPPAPPTQEELSDD